MSHNLLLFLWQLSYGLRTQNTLPQETGIQDYRVSIYEWPLIRYSPVFIRSKDDCIKNGPDFE